MHAIFALSLLASCAFALPSPSPSPKCRHQSFTDKVGLAVCPVAARGDWKACTNKSEYGGVTALGLLTPVDNTVGGALAYHGFDYQPGNVFSAPSPPNSIDFSISQQLTQGQPYAYPANSSVLSVDLKSFFFLCAIYTPASGISSTPESCQVLVTGTKAGTGGIRITQTFDFDPASLVIGTTLKQVFLPVTFGGLSKIEFAIIQSTTGQTATAFYMNNLAYNVYVCS